MRRKLGFASAMLGVAALILVGILASVNWVGTDAELYHELQMKAEILDTAGVSEEDLLILDAALANCLKGDSMAFYVSPVSYAETAKSLRMPITATVFGQVQPAFNDRELTHMEDCRQLFLLLRRVMNGLAAAGAVLLLVGVVLCWNRRLVRRAAWIAPLVILLPLGAFAAWAAVDFNSAFNFFHKLLFTNDLWLLDPRTDLLIRLCPLEMFMGMAVRIGILSLMAMLAVPAAVGICTSENKE